MNLSKEKLSHPLVLPFRPFWAAPYSYDWKRNLARKRPLWWWLKGTYIFSVEPVHSVQVFELSSFLQSYLCDWCVRTILQGHSCVYLKEHAPPTYLQLPSQLAFQSECWQMYLWERRCLVFYGKLWSKLPVVKVLFHKIFEEQLLSLLIYCNGMLSAAGDTKELILTPGSGVSIQFLSEGMYTVLSV